MSYLAARVNGKVDVFDIMWLSSGLPASLSSEVAQYRETIRAKVRVYFSIIFKSEITNVFIKE